MTNPTDVTVPPIPKDLLNFLQRVYPEQSPRIADTEREIWMKAGKCELVRVLTSQFEEQNQTVLTPKPTSPRVLRKPAKTKSNRLHDASASGSAAV